MRKRFGYKNSILISLLGILLCLAGCKWFKQIRNQIVERIDIDIDVDWVSKDADGNITKYDLLTLDNVEETIFAVDDNNDLE